MLPVPVDARRRHSSSTRPDAGWWPSRTSPSTKSSSRDIFPGAPLMPAVLMIESLVQVAAMLLAAARGRAPNARVYLRGVNDAKFRRQVVPGDRLRARNHARAGAARRSPARRRRRIVDDQVVAECELLLGLAADGDRHRPGRDRPSVAPRSATGPPSGRTPSIGPHVRIGPGLPVGASAVIDGLDGDRRRHRDLPVRLDRARCRRTSSFAASRRGS